MQLLELGTNRVLIDLTDSPKLYDFAPRSFDAGRQSYRRGDKRLVTNDSKRDRAELRFEFQRLTQAEVDTLEALYRSREHFICVPDPIDEPEKAYTVQWVSSFERSDTVVTDWTQGRSLQAVFRTVDDPSIYTPAIRIEIEGVDVTDRLTRDSQGRWEPITIGQSLDHPKQSVFRNSLISFNLDNEDGAFDYSSPNNFFALHNKPVHGRGAQVLIRLGLSKSEMIPAFAGQINEVQTSLGNTKARITIGGLSQKLNQNSVENFGEEITRRITDFDGANADYKDYNPVFYFPIGLRGIVRGSVRVTVHEEGGDVEIYIVDVVGRSGVLSNRNAEIDYARGLIRFELPPDDGADTEITATFKIDHRHKRPDYLIRELLKRAGIQSELGISDDRAARFGIEQALISHPTKESFSSHGRPYPAENGVVRWMRRDDSGKTPVWGMIQDQRYLEYDEYQDEYTKIATLPEESGLEGVVNNNYGQYLASESFTAQMGVGKGIAIDTENRRIYVTDRTQIAGETNSRILSYLFDGTQVTSETVTLNRSVQESLAVDDDYFYCGLFYGGSWRVYRFSRITGERDTSFDLNISGVPITADITPSRIIVMGVFHHILWITDRSGNRITTEERTFRNAIQTAFGGRSTISLSALAANDSHIFVQGGGSDPRRRNVKAFTHAYVEDPAGAITLRRCDIRVRRTRSKQYKVVPLK